METLWIVEQEVVFGDIALQFGDSSLLITIANHEGYSSIKEAKEDGWDKPKRYKVSMQIRYEEIMDGHQ